MITIFLVPASSKDKYRPFQAVSAAASADDYGGEMTPDISDDDLGYFYSFCSMLPRLEAMGRIPKNKKTQAMCSKLQFVLNPMFGNGALKNYKWV